VSMNLLKRPISLIHVRFRSRSLLLPLRPDFTFITRINKLLEPSRHVLSIFHSNLQSGGFQKFAERVWEKAWTKDPFVLASRSCSKAYEMWKQGPSGEDDGRRNPP
jgi:hypothetical protein